ncbi:MAG: DUF296 domain-containing protein [Christensenella sp.]|nr:DUF296 domain-containing protein [Christensenella sp.]
MDYRNTGKNILIRLDKGDKIMENILQICQKENVKSAQFYGIGACTTATVSTFIPENNDFIDHTASGMLELISMMGNVSSEDDGSLFVHCHTVFSYLDQEGKPAVLAGHLKEAEIFYTGEIILIPSDYVIHRMEDPATGVSVWKF